MLAPQVSPLNPPTLFPKISGIFIEKKAPAINRSRYFERSIVDGIDNR